jgi:sterol desaturase/sphingolipid hydroxylase (fatty acid hydroxylase superfamily)
MRISTLLSDPSVSRIAAATGTHGPASEGTWLNRRARNKSALSVASINSLIDPASVLKDEEASDKRKKASAALLTLLMLSLASYLGGVYLLSVIVGHWPAGPSGPLDIHVGLFNSLRTVLLQPATLIAVVAFFVAFELGCIKLDQSTINRLIAGAFAPTRVDLFYIGLRLTGGINVLVFAFFFGTIFWLTSHLHLVLHIAILQHVHSSVLQFSIVYLIDTFLVYWVHRLMHSRRMWEIHKPNPSADKMHLVTFIRNHPIKQIVMSLPNAFLVSLLGGSPGVVVSYYALNMLYQSLLHSEINLKGKFWDKIWITSAAHRIHHSNRTEHFDSNFVVMALWDHFFGAYHAPSREKPSCDVLADDPSGTTAKLDPV